MWSTTRPRSSCCETARRCGTLRIGKLKQHPWKTPCGRQSRAEDRGQVGSRKSEVRGRRSEVRGRKSEVRGQQSEVRGHIRCVEGGLVVRGERWPVLPLLTSDL